MEEVQKAAVLAAVMAKVEQHQEREAQAIAALAARIERLEYLNEGRVPQ